MKRVLFTCIFSLFAFFSAVAQETVNGRVVDAEGNAVIVATVVVAESNTGAVTDENGQFSLAANPGDQLIVSSIGYLKQTVAASSDPMIITLERDQTTLNETVVTALGIKRDQKTLGYTVQQIDGADIQRSNTPNVVDALAGKVASVNITNPNGVEGGTSRIVIDGNNSLTGDNQPLIIVDGIPMENEISEGAASMTAPRDWGSPINLINANDIENINILKGPAAAALYGGRGANGVIIITTKKGEKNEGLGVNYSYSYKTVRPYRYIDLQNEYGTGGPVSLEGPAYQLDDDGKPRLTDGNIQYYADQKTGSGPFGVATWDQGSWPGSGSSWGPALDGTEITWWDGEVRPATPQPDNVKFMYNNGSEQKHSVNVSGGNDWGTLRASFTHLENEAIVPNSGYNQNSFNLGSSMQLTKKMHLTISTSYYINKYHNAPQLGNDDASSWQKRMLYNVGRDYKGLDIDNYKNPDGTRNSLTGFPFVGNGGYVVWNIMENNETQTRRKLVGSAQFDYAATDFLDLMFRAGLDHNNNENVRKDKPIDLTGLSGGGYGHGLTRNNTADFTWMATYHRAQIFDSDVNVKFSVGGEAWSRDFYSISGSNNSWSMPNLYYFGTYTGNPSATSESTIKQKLNSLYGLLNLSFKSWLYLDITGRNDWSSALPRGEWSYFFPSASASFIFTDALDIESDVLSYGKLRAAWAQAAVPPSPYMVNNVYNAGSFAGQLTLSLPETLPAAHYKPQINTTMDLGLTLGFLKNRLTLDMRYYHGKAKNQILSSPLPLSSGVGSLFVSEGVLENSGMEFTINAQILNTPAVKWSTYLQGSHSMNKVLSLPEGASQIDLGSVWGDGGSNGPVMRVAEGEEYGTIYGRDYVYYNDIRTPENRVLATDPFGKPEMNGTMYESTSELVPIGNAKPDLIFGWGNNFTFPAGFSLGFIIDGKMGGDIWSGTYATTMRQGQAPQTLKERNGGGLPYTTPGGKQTNWGVVLPGKFEDGTPNDNVVMYYYKYLQYGVWSSGPQYSNWINTGAVFKDNWIKLRELSINYAIPDDFVRKTGVFQNASIALVGRDLFYLHSSLPNHINPEGANGAGNGQGLEFASLPSFRSFSFQVNVSF